MRMIKNQKSSNDLKLSPLLKRKKPLTIEVPDEFSLNLPKSFSKNSPKYSKSSLIPKKSIQTESSPKLKAAKSIKSLKKLTKTTRTPLKTFKFSLTPKSSKMSPPKPLNLTSRIPKSKGMTPISKLTKTPTNKKFEESTVKRSKTVINIDKNNPKTETGPNPSLNGLVTKIRSSPIKYKEKILSLEDKSEMLYKEHLFQTFQAMKFIRTLQPVNLEQLKEKRISIPKPKGWENKKTIIFDLDETLVHCCEDIANSNPSVILPVTFPTGEIVQAGINIRPFTIECLKQVNKDFEVFVFTASHPCYANVVLDYLDPEKKLIHHRFFRDSCLNVGGVYLKDLRIFENRNLKDMIIVDNAAYSFGYQLDNGIPIISWRDDPNDKELFHLMDYVQTLSAVDDIRDVNEQTFHLRTFYEDYINEFLANETSEKKTIN